MKCTLSLFGLLFLSWSTWASDLKDDSFRTLIQIEHVGRGPKLFMVEKKAFVPSIPATEEIKQALEQLNEGSQILVEGRIHVETGQLETQGIRPFFIIEKIIPVSLSDLGKEARAFQFEAPRSIELPSTVFGPSSIPVTTEIASAITLTTGLLLLEELSSSGRAPEDREQRQLLLLSTGAFATLLFIYDQIKGESKL
jgi:hypothetical protein